MSFPWKCRDVTENEMYFGPLDKTEFFYTGNTWDFQRDSAYVRKPKSIKTAWRVRRDSMSEISRHLLHKLIILFRSRTGLVTTPN